MATTTFATTTFATPSSTVITPNYANPFGTGRFCWRSSTDRTSSPIRELTEAQKHSANAAYLQERLDNPVNSLPDAYVRARQRRLALEREQLAQPDQVSSTSTPTSPTPSITTNTTTSHMQTVHDNMVKRRQLLMNDAYTLMYAEHPLDSQRLHHDQPPMDGPPAYDEPQPQPHPPQGPLFPNWMVYDQPNEVAYIEFMRLCNYLFQDFQGNKLFSTGIIYLKQVAQALLAQEDAQEDDNDGELSATWIEYCVLRRYVDFKMAIQLKELDHSITDLLPSRRHLLIAPSAEGVYPSA